MTEISNFFTRSRNNLIVYTYFLTSNLTILYIFLNNNFIEDNFFKKI
jgi:hypothetical protein